MKVVFTHRRYYKGVFHEVGEEIDMPEVYAKAYMNMGAVKLSPPPKVNAIIQKIVEDTEKIDFAKLTVAELQKIAKERDLSPYGRKQELIDRLSGE